MISVVVSVTVGVAFLSVASILAYAAIRNTKIPGRVSYWVFALTLAFSGMARMMDPFDGQDARLHTIVLTIAAACSVVTLVLTANNLPNMLAARSPEELADANRKFRLMAESVQDYAIFLMDLHGNISSWNIGAERIKGFAAAEILGKHFSTFYTQADRDRNHPEWEIEQVKRDGRYAEEGWRVRKNGTLFWASVTITALRAPDGKLEGFAKVTRDLTEKKRYEDELCRLNELLHMRMTAVEAFNNSVCHDLHAPLRAMEGFAKALVEDLSGQTDPTILDYLQRIRIACERMRNLVRDLLRLSHVNHEELRANRVRFSMSDMMWEVVQQERSYDNHLKHEVEIQSGMEANGDPTLVRLLVENLVANAFKFSGKHSQPVIRMGKIDGEFFVCDNGIGFDQQMEDRLFQPFSRLHSAAEYPGTGIGLTICKRVTDIHGGNIRGKGKPGEGACFYFTLGECKNNGQYQPAVIG